MQLNSRITQRHSTIDWPTNLDQVFVCHLENVSTLRYIYFMHTAKYWMNHDLRLRLQESR